jgi:glycerol uptake facilitator-like aquaporin
MSMTTGGWLMISMSWCIIIIVTVYCFVKVFSEERDENI